uniref:Uncharacterized protein n=1 Tax=Romanomermis culicivorax TaxID=13658 RepID=A0A915KA07_ROMCU
DSLKEKWNTSSNNCKLAILGTVSIIIILLVVFTIVVAGSKRRGGVLGGVGLDAHNAVRRKILNGEVPNQPKAAEMPDLV